MVPPSAYERWIDPSARVSDLLRGPADIELVAYAVSPYVNSPAHDDPKCLEPADVVQPGLFG